MAERILIFSLGYYPAMVGGAEVAIKEITERISPSAAEFDMVTLRYDKRLPRFERIGNVNIYRIGFAVNNPQPKALIRFPLYLLKVWYPLGAFFKAYGLSRKQHYTRMWSMMSYMGFPAMFLKIMKPSVFFILTLQEGDTISHITQRRRIQLVSFLYRKIFKKADLVQCISHYLADFARSMGYTGDILIIPNGVDIKHFTEIHNVQEEEKLKEKLSKKTDDIFLITTSRLVEKNAVNDIIAALSFLPKKLKLLILGTGPLEATLKDQVKNLQLESRVFFLGYITHKELPSYLRICDIFIRPSLSEGMGISFIEAMACNVPVITTKVGGIVDFLKDNETGLFVEVNNPQDIAEKVERLCNDAELRERIIEKAALMVKETYTWDKIAEDMRQKVFNV